MAAVVTFFVARRGRLRRLRFPHFGLCVSMRVLPVVMAFIFMFRATTTSMTPMATTTASRRMAVGMVHGAVHRITQRHRIVLKVLFSVMAEPQQIIVHDATERQREHQHELVGQSRVNLEDGADDPGDEQRGSVDDISPQQTVAERVRLLSVRAVMVRSAGHREHKVLIKEMLPNHRGEIRDTVRNGEAVAHDEQRESEPVSNHKVEAQKEDIKEHRGDDGAHHEEVLLLHLERLFVQLLLPFLNALTGHHHKLKRRAHHFKADGVGLLENAEQSVDLAPFQPLLPPRVHRARVRGAVAPSIFVAFSEHGQLGDVHIVIILGGRLEFGKDGPIRVVLVGAEQPGSTLRIGL